MSTLTSDRQPTTGQRQLSPYGKGKSGKVTERSGHTEICSLEAHRT